MSRKFILSALAVFLLCPADDAHSAIIKGELKKWHRVTLLFNGPATSEDAPINPFTEYRLTVTFTNGSDTMLVYGHYAADGNAAETSDSSGNKWRVYFCPPKTGVWYYKASFRTGTKIALSDAANAGSSAGYFDDETGSFTIGATNKTGNDFRAKGRLTYTGKHYLQFAETGGHFIKGGTDSPENLLAYYQFDQTYDRGGASTPNLINGLHQFAPHLPHWHAGDPSWQNGKGKGIIGALNYLASRGINSIYFLTYNLDGGDGRDTWMWTSPAERWRFDVSKLDQWEIVFQHADSLGIQLHFVTQEMENDHLLGGSGSLNDIRKLYYRELVSRFAHHLGVLWNLGEENDNTDTDRVAFAQYIRSRDPYRNPITFHTYQNQALTVYDSILSNPSWLQYFEMASLQGTGSSYNNWAKTLRADSEAAGRKWIICGDEQDPVVDPAMPASNLNSLRKDALWGNLMGGGGGVEWYFGYQGSFGDLQSEDWTVVEKLWDQTRYALEFFQTYLPFHEMKPDNSLFSATNGASGYCFAKEGEIYAVYIKPGVNNVTVSVDLAMPGTYRIQWYNPRTGGALQNGSLTTVTSTGGTVSIGQNPANDNNDWVALVTNTTAVIPPASTTWTGAVSNDWFTAFNWTSGVPTASVDAVIPNVSPASFPLIEGIGGTSAEVKNLMLNAGAQLTISGLNNVQLAVYGNLTNSGQILGTGRLSFSGNAIHWLSGQLSFSGVLQVKAGSTLVTNGNLTLEDGASLLHGTGTPNGGGALSGPIKMKRNANTNAAAYSYWASPVAGATVTLLGNDLYYYVTDNATDLSEGGLRNGWVAASGTMTPALGYIARGNPLVEFSGTPNNGNYTVAVTKNAVTGVGWNLIGNPYPSSIDATAFMAVNGPAGSNPVVMGSLYFWDDDASNGFGWSSQDYAVWSGAGTVAGPNSGIFFQGHIASCQGFFTEKLSPGTAAVQFTNSMRSSRNNAFFRQTPIQRFWISAIGPDGDYNETLVAFMDDAADDADPLYDAKKMKGSSKISLYTKVHGADYAIQAIPLLNNDRSLVMGMDAGVSGTYTLNLKTVENIDETISIYLEDTFTGQWQDLRLHPYVFYSSTGIFDTRFILHFTAALEITVKQASCEGNDGEITLIQNGTKIWDYVLSAASGTNIESSTGFNGTSTITNLKEGAYVLSVRDSNGYNVTRTIIVRGAPTVTADYYLSSSEVFVNEPVSFNNQSSGAVRYQWHFGDGSSSADAFPVHAYARPGIYEVTLLAENNECSGSKSSTIRVVNKEPSAVENAAAESVHIFGFESTVYVEFANVRCAYATIDVFSTTGEKLVAKTLHTAFPSLIELPAPAPGCYMVRVTYGKACRTVKVVIAAR